MTLAAARIGTRIGTPEARRSALPAGTGSLIQRKCACGGKAGMSGECDECKARKLTGVQTKSANPALTIGPADDVFEREADRVAEQVTRSPVRGDAVAQVATRRPAPPAIRRLGPSSTQRESDIGGNAPASVERVLSSAGAPLEPELRAGMGRSFGFDFARVRIHSDGEAARSARAISAQAFTAGSHVVFGTGKFDPGRSEGRRLLAPELTHVVQQSGSGGAPSPAAPAQRVMRKPDDEAHYPTEEEQKKIEKLFERERKTKRLETTSTGEVVEEKGRKLTAAQASELADRLEGPFNQELDKLDTPVTSTGNVLDESGARATVADARKAVLAHFGSYTTRVAALTYDPKIPDAEREKTGQVLVVLGDPDAAYALAITVLHGCDECKAELEDLDDTSQQTVKAAVIATAFRKREAQLRRVAKDHVPGKHGEEGKITLRLTPRDQLYPTAVHELIHQLTHPAFHAAFLAKDRNIVEGFTEYFAREIVGHDPKVKGLYDKFAQKVADVGDLIKGPFTFSSIGGSAEESLRQAYFGGRLDLIGWTPGSEEERARVEKAGGSAPWDPKIAAAHADANRAQAQEAQNAKSNVLGVGLYFTRGSESTVGVRYARVLTRLDPLAKKQVSLEGQLFGSPTTKPSLLRASLGIEAEYQEPHFYAGAGVRFVGTTGLGDGTDRLDVSPFVGVGVRWQSIRVGAEAMVLLPLTGQDVQVGAGVTVGVEFGK